MPLPQVAREPGDAEIEDHGVGDVHDAQREDVSIREQLAPIGQTGRMTAIRGAFRDDQLQFLGIDRGMLRGIVAIPGKPDRRPHETDAAETHEDLAPRQEAEQPQYQRRRQAADQVRAREEDALHRPALALGNPAGECPRHARPCARFTHAEQKADGEQDRIIERRAGRRREAGPPEHNPRQHRPRALAIRPPRRGNLEQRIGQLKEGEDIPHLDRGEPEIPDDAGGQRPDAGSIEVGDHPKPRGQGDDAIARVSRRRHKRALYANAAATRNRAATASGSAHVSGRDS